MIEDGGSEDEAIAALLHDAAEDQGGQRRLDEIEALFGPIVALGEVLLRRRHFSGEDLA